MRELPPGWAHSSVSDLIAGDGVFADGDWVESKDQDPDGDVRLVQLADVGDGAFLDKSSRFLTATRAVELRCTTLKEGDILIARMPNPLGRACIFPGSARECVTVVDVCIVRPGRVGSDPQWLMYAINAPQMRLAIAALQSGSTRQRISRNNLAGIAIPVPPIPEQRRTVAEIEKHLARIDTVVEQLAATQRKIAAFVTSVIRHATSAKPHWRMTRAADLCEFITKGTTPSADQLLAVGDIPYLKVNNLTFGGPLDFSRSRTFIRKNVHDNELSRSKVLPGDVLMNIVGPPLGKVAVVPDSHPEYNINQAIARFRPVSGINPRYLALLLRNGEILSWALSRAKTTAGQVNLTLELCRDLPLPIAPETEQREIVTAVDAALTLSENASTLISANLARAARLRQAILTKAFEGKLVPQDPSDEPASVLLQRIRSTRNARPRLKKQENLWPPMNADER